MRRPLSFALGNLVFGASVDEPWAMYRVQTNSYPGLSMAGKKELMAGLASFAYAVGADFQVLRVSRPWSLEVYRQGVDALADLRFAHDAELAGYLDRHVGHLAGRRVCEPEVFLCVALGAATDVSSSAAQLVRSARRLVGLDDARGISSRRLEDLRAAEDRAFACARDFLDCERTTTDELAWLVRRAFSRAVAPPVIDELWQPQALIEDAPAEVGGSRMVPLGCDVMRLADAPIEVGARGLRISGEDGESHQALLTLGALPEFVSFPGREAELLFAPLEAVGFPVDAVVSVRWVANDQAVALARRKVLDADNTFAEEANGDHGPTSQTAARPSVARELEEYLTRPDRPPLLRATIGLCVAADSPGRLDERVARLRREYAPVQLHRPLGSQLDLFVSHLPAQRCAVRDYEDLLTAEQLGAMVPTATYAVGSPAGMYVGHTLSGSGQPVLFDLSEASRTSRPAAILCAGTLGSGKTLTAELLAYQAFLLGSRVVAIDPKGDHHLHDYIARRHVETIELQAGGRDRGRLDPLRIAPAETRADLAHSFLTDLLPGPVEATWQTEIRDAVDRCVEAGSRCCGDVLAALKAGNDHAQQAGRALEVHARAGLLQLGFADAGALLDESGSRQVTLLRIAGLALPLPGTPRSDYTNEERAGQALLRLLASYALRLTSGEPDRHKVLIFDEAWMLLGDAAGRALVSRINRLCRSQNATPILATQVLADVAELENLIGAYLCFGVETDSEARRVLQALGMDADDPRLISLQQGFRQGRCHMRDYHGRVAPVQIDLADPALLAALDTTPQRTPVAA